MQTIARASNGNAPCVATIKAADAVGRGVRWTADGRLEGAVNRGPARQHFNAERADDDDRRDDNQAGNQGVFDDFRAVLVMDE